MPCRVLCGCCWCCCMTSQSSCVSITSSCAMSSRPAASRCATSSCQPSPATCACPTPSPPTSRWTCCLRSTRAPDLFQSHRTCFQLSSGTTYHPSVHTSLPSSTQVSTLCTITTVHTVRHLGVAIEVVTQYAFVAAPQEHGALSFCVHRSTVLSFHACTGCLVYSSSCTAQDCSGCLSKGP